MRTNGYTNEEIKILNNNHNVVMVKYGRQVEYKESFKNWAVIQSFNHPELSAMQIFELAGFDRNIINPRNAESRLRDWKRKPIRTRVIIRNEMKKNEEENLAKKNNDILLILLSRFDHLINILGRK